MDILKTMINKLINGLNEEAEDLLHDYIVSKTQEVVSEAKEAKVPVYVCVSGTWYDHYHERIHAGAVYKVDAPSKEVAEKIVSSLESLAAKEDVNDMVDRFEQDGWDPRDGDGHAEEVSVDEVSLVKPTGRGRTLVNKYTMVYFLRDLDLLDDDYAKKIAKQ